MIVLFLYKFKCFEIVSRLLTRPYHPIDLSKSRNEVPLVPFHETEKSRPSVGQRRIIFGNSDGYDTPTATMLRVVPRTNETTRAENIGVRL
jgi:hypothetical protein